MRCAFIVAVCMLVAEAWAANDVGEDFRNDLKEISSICEKSYCPAYTVKETANDYELREYIGHYFIETGISNIDQKLAQYVLFLRLKGYTMGDNVSYKKVQSGLPIFTRYYIEKDWTLVNNFTEFLYVATKPSKHIPAPLNPLVQVITWPTMSFYAASYTRGFLTIDETIGHAYSLAQALKRDNRTFVESEFGVAHYDNLDEHYRRHHEIFFIAN